MSIKTDCRDVIKGLLIGIMCFYVIILFVEPIAKYISEAILISSNTFATYISNIIYLNAARGLALNDSIPNIQLFMFFTLSLSLYMYLTIEKKAILSLGSGSKSTIKAIKSIYSYIPKNDFKIIINQLNANDSKYVKACYELFDRENQYHLLDNLSNEQISYLILLFDLVDYKTDDRQKMRSKVDYLDKQAVLINKTLRIIKQLLTLIVVITFSVSFFYLTKEVIIDKPSLLISKEFQHKITIIEPYITLGELKRIKSQWALVKNKKDYISIDSIINGIAKKNGLDISF